MLHIVILLLQVRYCCTKKKASQWGAWSKWSKCSRSCDGGIRTRDRVCVQEKGQPETCFGNWFDAASAGGYGGKGKDKFAPLKKQEAKCNEEQCPSTKLPIIRSVLSSNQ